MQDIVVGAFAIAAGLLLCFRGYLVMRVIIPIWGFFAGFMFGAGLVAAIFGEGFLASVTGWIVGFIVALLFAGLAFLFYEVAVIIGMSAIGFSLGAGAMAALGVSWSWIIVLVGLAVGLALAFAALVLDLPAMLLALLTALGGAAVAVFGAMLLFGTIDLDVLDNATTTEVVSEEWWSYVLFLVLAVAGIVAQARMTVMLRLSLREQWIEAGGQQLRAS